MSAVPEPAAVPRQRLLVLDFGSQYTQLIARRVREAGIYSEIHPGDWQDERIAGFRPRAVILSGGPGSAAAPAAGRIPEAVFRLDVPVLGICYGMQAMAAQLGGGVEAAGRREFGPARVRARGHSRLLRGIQDAGNEQGHGLLDVWMSHGDRVSELPPGFKVIASTADSPVAAMADESRRLYGLQFHPEVTHTRQGEAILRRFLYEIAGCKKEWTPGHIAERTIQEIRARVGERDKVLHALSGGVDSAVAALLLHRALGEERLQCVFVDNGLLRLGEADEVMAAFADRLGLPVRRVEAAQKFLDALAGVQDPEEKRRIVGRGFIEAFEQVADGLLSETGGAAWLAQGTIYSDVVESAAAAAGKTKLIKSHHNVGGLPERMRLPLIEPLRELFKDEVRRLGAHLGLPPEWLSRHPFPGPGLAVRVLGEVRPGHLALLRRADHIFLEELRRSGWYQRLSQAFAVFLPVRAVGVQGDERRYEHVVALRAVQTDDFMTANWACLPAELLESVSARIMNEVPGLSRVVYDISSKPPATIEWE